MRERCLFFALAIFATSCVRDNYSRDCVLEDNMQCVLRCEIEKQAVDTKTELLSDSTTIVWRANDDIILFGQNGEKDSFHLISGIGTTSASFAGTLPGEAPYYFAFYPASGDVAMDDNILSFHLPGTQTFARDSFGENASPMVGYAEDLTSPIQFNNLCGMLCLRLSANPSFRVSKLVVKDLAGNMLWGDCRLTLDGRQGSDAQTMSITGGSDEITLTLPSPLSLSDSSPIKFYIVVPPGALNNGFSVSVFDETGEKTSVLKTLNNAVIVERAMITNMSRFVIKTEPSDPGKRGYYKDLFMDSGIRLVNRRYLQSAEDIKWDYEYQAPQARYSQTENDVILQRAFFEQAEDDLNGYLLYPDRQPRFRCIYINGGSSKEHGKSLGAKGRKAVYDFVYNGGSYVGTCAGAFVASSGYDSETNYKDYIKIFPGHMYHTIIKHDRPDMILSEDSPLLSYYDFGDMVPSVLHSGGGYMSEEEGRVPAGTEVLLRYGVWPSGTPSDEGKVGCWAYKPSESTGRMILCGSHPEYGTGEKRNDFRLFAALLQYAADGSGIPPVKATLSNGLWYKCEAMSSENDPSHARIGDRQYHHFTVDIPEGAKNLVIQLKSNWDEEDLYLSLNQGDYAWFSEAEYFNDDNGSNKTLKIRKPKAGTWYVSVYAPNTVTAELTKYDTSGLYYKYTENTHLLNGIPYSIKVDWE